jgi:hypothetical protein
MTIYLCTILLLFMFSVLETNYNLSVNRKKWMFFIAYSVLVIQVGLRWETGTDWNPYLAHFENITDFASTSPFLNGFEYGYSILVWLVKLISPEYTLFLLLHAIIYYLLIFKSFQRYTPYLYLSMMMYYTLSMGMMGSNRQLIALGICIYALRFVIEKKPIFFLLLIILAICFHTTAFLFIIYYFLNRNIKPLTLILILFLSFVIGKTQLPNIIFSNIGDLIGGKAAIKVFQYLQGAADTLSEYKLSIIGLLKRVIFLTIFYYNRKKISEKLIYYNTILNGYIVGIAFYFLFGPSLLVMVSKGSLYFNIMEPLLIASQFCLLKRKENKAISIAVLLIFAFFFFYQSITTYPDLFLPYKGIFINSDFQRSMY